MEPTAATSRSQDDGAAYWVGAVAGALLWIGTSILSDKREAWDGGVYWAFAYPASVALAAWLSWKHPQRVHRWALAVFLGQFAGMVVRNGEIGSLAPLGIILFAVLSLPAIAIGTLVARRKKRA